MGLVIRRADVSLFGEATGPVDLRLEDGVIAAVERSVHAERQDEELDAAGGTVLPGFHDHHLHLRALAMAEVSVQAGPPHVRNAAELALRLAEAADRTPPGDWIRAIGYHPSVAGDLDRQALDAMCATHPLRMQHASGALWTVNTLALERLSVDHRAPAGVERDRDGQPTGRIWREDRWLAARAPAPVPDLAAISRRAASAGVTGFTDATPDNGPSDLHELTEAVLRGSVLQRLHLMAVVGVASSEPRMTVGPVKIVLDDPTLPSLDSLKDAVAEAHAGGRPVAIHCVTRVQGVLATAAIAEADRLAGDRIEHGAVLPREILPTLRRLGVTVVTQPAMMAARADRYLEEVDADDRPDLWRAGSLLAAGVRLAGSTDAPYGPFDPWRVVVDAVSRESPSGAVLGPAERLRPARAIRLLTGWAEQPARSREVRVGQPADLCLLEGRLELSDLGSLPPVRATVVAGQLVHLAGG